MFLDATWVDLELFITRFVLSLVSRHHWIKVEDAFVGCFQVTQDCTRFRRTSLSFMRLASRWQSDVFSALGCDLSRFCQKLILEIWVHHVSWEVLRILLLQHSIQVFDLLETALGQQLHLLRPYDRYAHKLATICDYCAGQQVRISIHETLLIHAKVSEELCISPKVSLHIVVWTHGIVENIVFVLF